MANDQQKDMLRVLIKGIAQILVNCSDDVFFLKTYCEAMKMSLLDYESFDETKEMARIANNMISQLIEKKSCSKKDYIQLSEELKKLIEN